MTTITFPKWKPPLERTAYITLDREAGVITFNLGPGRLETYQLTDDWLQQYFVCRFCAQAVDDERTIEAAYSHRAPVCSTVCAYAERAKADFCCDKAEYLPCVCTVAIRCPDHGEHHRGTHS